MKTRAVSPEKLDNLSLNGKELEHALQSLEWVNRQLGNHRSVTKAINRIYQKEKKHLEIIDLGCGGGDLAAAIARSLRALKASFSITGIDGNLNSLQYARGKYGGYPELFFEKANILDPGFRVKPCDILVSSHFIYHFTEDGLIQFLHTNMPAVSTAFICSELERSKMALSAFRHSSFLLPLSKMAKEDGQLAIQRSFTRKEWMDILNHSGIQDYKVKKVLLFRLLITIYPNRN